MLYDLEAIEKEYENKEYEKAVIFPFSLSINGTYNIIGILNTHINCNFHFSKEINTKNYSKYEVFYNKNDMPDKKGYYQKYKLLIYFYNSTDKRMTIGTWNIAYTKYDNYDDEEK